MHRSFEVDNLRAPSCPFFIGIVEEGPVPAPFWNHSTCYGLLNSSIGVRAGKRFKTGKAPLERYDADFHEVNVTLDCTTRTLRVTSVTLDLDVELRDLPPNKTWVPQTCLHAPYTNVVFTRCVYFDQPAVIKPDSAFNSASD